MAYDELNQGLIKVGIQVTKPAENFTWGQSVLFGDPAIGTDQDLINLDTEVGDIAIPEEAVKGLDPTRVNYGTSFNTKRVASQYYFMEDTVDLSSAKNRLFGEPVDAPWSVEKRELVLAAKKRDAMAQALTLKKEMLAFETALNGKFVTKNDGEQSFPISAELLNISGANLIAKPFETISAVAKTLFEHGIALKRIVLNPTDAANLGASAPWQNMLDKKKVTVGEVAPREADNNGMSYLGTIIGLVCGSVQVFAYAGFYKNAEGNIVNFIPQGKALLLPANAIGRPGYTGILEVHGNVQAKVAAKENYLVYSETRGNLATTKIQAQTAPAMLITSIDGYGVMTGIPTV